MRKMLKVACQYFTFQQCLLSLFQFYPGIIVCLLDSCLCFNFCFFLELLDEEKFSVELIVQCVRTSEMPQTHHQALLLLGTAAGIFPVRSD